MTGTELAAAAGKKLAIAVLKTVGGKAIERWTKYRAGKFFEAFVDTLSEELKSGIESGNANSTLEEMLESDVKSEVFYDAYRMVCFAKSKTLGPQIIGFLTGYLVSEGRMAEWEEECIFGAAEALSDAALIDFFKTYKRLVREADESKERGYEQRNRHPHWERGTLVLPVELGGHLPAYGPRNTTPFTVWGHFEGQGWPRELERLDMVSCKTEKQAIEAEIMTGTKTIFFDATCGDLCKLIARALGPSGPEGA